ncbi:hypothetical protein PPGU19_023450 [Paraburkholderia sp. PGU19]|nr:hypothetical protein PPGU19_023450 [Paraburkholderia sp. PGU19]
MNIHLTLGPLVALIAGILILIVPRLLNFIVALYLIIIGLIGLFGVGARRTCDARDAHTDAPMRAVRCGSA